MASFHQINGGLRNKPYQNVPERRLRESRCKIRRGKGGVCHCVICYTRRSFSTDR